MSAFFDAHAGAHLRALPRCQECKRPATQELFNGRNASVGLFCDRCAPPALRRFKRAGQ